MKLHCRNISHSIYLSTVYGFYNKASNNQIWNQLLWEDLHPAPDIFSLCLVCSLFIEFISLFTSQSVSHQFIFHFHAVCYPHPVFAQIQFYSYQDFGKEDIHHWQESRRFFSQSNRFFSQRIFHFHSGSICCLKSITKAKTQQTLNQKVKIWVKKILK